MSQQTAAVAVVVSDDDGKKSLIDEAFFVFQRRLGLHEKTARLRSSSSSALGPRLLYAATVLVVLSQSSRCSLVTSPLRVLATVLVLASLLTPVACLVLGFARYAARHRLDELNRHRRPADGGLSYDRVDSVSSIVDSQRRNQEVQLLYQDVEEMTVI